MDTEEREQHKLNLIKIILASSGYKETELLSIYAFYLSSAPDTLYNISYYTDRIDEFLEKVNSLPKKVKCFGNIFNKIKSEIDLHPLKDQFTFTFDDLFVYTTKSTMDVKKEKVDLFRLDLVDLNRFSLRMKIGDHDLFREYYSKDQFKEVDPLVSEIAETILKYYPLPKQS